MGKPVGKAHRGVCQPSPGSMLQRCPNERVNRYTVFRGHPGPENRTVGSNSRRLNDADIVSKISIGYNRVFLAENLESLRICSIQSAFFVGTPLLPAKKVQNGSLLCVLS